MKGVVFSFVLGLGVVASGCGVFDVYRDRQMDATRSSATQDRQPPPQFSRPPICTSTLLGGQVITTCR